MDNRSFDSKRIALGYAKRPWLHKSVIEQLLCDCNLDESYKFKNGLDVGCGAGLSAKALRLICDKVTGTDIADSMVEVCKELYGDDKAYSFYVAKAEETKLSDTKYDIVTDAGFCQLVDELAVVHAILTDGSVDTHDPQAAELALLVPSVAISVGLTLFVRVFRHSPHVLSRAELTFGLFQDFFPSGS